MKKVEIYFNQSKLLITNDSRSEKTGFGWVIDTHEEAFAFRMNPHWLFDEEYNNNILVITDFVDEFVESLFDFAEGIVAAGGIVSNEREEILIMYRRGFWDLPKGKVDKGEKIKTAAVREVAEETGVKADMIAEEPIKTYHCYTLRDTNIIKETYWYKMKANGVPLLLPQEEEGITQVLWADIATIKYLEKDFYPLVFRLLRDTLSIGT